MSKFKPRKGVTAAQYPKFFAMCRRACDNMGIYGKEEIEAYRHKVMIEEAGCASIKEMNCTGHFDACIKRFAADAGDFEAAIGIDLMGAVRRAYVVKVMAMQVMQLKGGDVARAREYLEGILDRCGARVAKNDAEDGWFMDVSERSLTSVLQILDTYRRKLVRAEFPRSPLKFDDTVRYRVDGVVTIRESGIDPAWYRAQPFTVNVRKEVAA